jgi:transcriptional regulator GlxA family with amidase domain
MGSERNLLHGRVGGRPVLAGAGTMVHDVRMQIAFVLYPKFTALDIVGPFQTLVDAPGVEACFVAEATGPVIDHTSRLSMIATHSFSEITAPEVIVVPGGFPDMSRGQADPVVQWIRAVHPTTTWTTSVCTGSLYLALAGVLAGVDATGHWAAMDALESLGASPSGTRVVERGKVMTAAGVSSGIDMGLTLAARMFGDDIARVIQLAIEYDPQPPFDAGSPEKAGPELVELVRSIMAVPEVPAGA